LNTNGAKGLAKLSKRRTVTHIAHIDLRVVCVIDHITVRHKTSGVNSNIEMSARGTQIRRYKLQTGLGTAGKR
jgi:hypothetical protein